MTRQQGNKSKNDSTLVQVLSLYLLLLAFFVLLYNHSRVEGANALKVAGSLKATFSDQGAKFDRPVPVTSMLADSLAEAKFQNAMGKLVKTEIPISEVDVVKRGRLLRARMPPSQLFLPGQAKIRTDRLAFVRHVAESLAASPPGIRYDVEVVFDGGWITPKMLGQKPTLEILRATSIAVALKSFGAPPGTIAVGVRQGKSPWIGLNFHVRIEEAGRTTLPIPESKSGDAG